MWIPADLASTGAVPSTDPNLSPCSATLDDTIDLPVERHPDRLERAVPQLDRRGVDHRPGGLVTTTTNVSYHFTPRADGTFDLDAHRVPVDGRWRVDVDRGPVTSSHP